MSILSVYMLCMYLCVGDKTCVLSRYQKQRSIEHRTHLCFLWDLCRINMIVEVSSKVSVRGVKRIIDSLQSLIILLGPLKTPFKLLLTIYTLITEMTYFRAKVPKKAHITHVK